MGKLFRELRDYAELRLKSYKLTAVELLSVLMAKALAIIIFILLLSVALMLFTVTLTLLLAYLIDSIIWATVIMGALYLIVALLFYFLRGSVFTGSMVKMLCGTLFPEKDMEKYERYKKEEYYDDYDSLRDEEEEEQQ